MATPSRSIHPLETPLLDFSQEETDQKKTQEKSLSQELSSSSLQNVEATDLLESAVREGSFVLVRKHIAEGGDVHRKTDTGATLLHIACDKIGEKLSLEENVNFVTVIQILLEARCNVLAKDADGITPLRHLIHQAFIRQHRPEEPFVRAACLMIESHANVNVVTQETQEEANIERRMTSLQVAVGSTYPRLVQLLIDSNAHLNQCITEQRFKGKTALHLASALPDGKMVALLLRANADSNIQDNLGNTPLHVACSQLCVRNMELLLPHTQYELRNRENLPAFSNIQLALFLPTGERERYVDAARRIVNVFESKLLEVLSPFLIVDLIATVASYFVPHFQYKSLDTQEQRASS